MSVFTRCVSKTSGTPVNHPPNTKAQSPDVNTIGQLMHCVTYWALAISCGGWLRRGGKPSFLGGLAGVFCLNRCNFKETHHKRGRRDLEMLTEELSKQSGDLEAPCHDREDHSLGTRRDRLKETRKKTVTADDWSKSSLFSGSRENLFYWEVQPLRGFKDRSDINMSAGIYP